MQNARASGQAGAQRAPHIVVLLIDDLGIDDTSVRVPNATSEQPNGLITPHISGLRETGILLSQYYSFKFCSPSRSQLLTGRYAYHLGQQTARNLNPVGAACGLNASYTMLPALLRRAGYWSAGFGKWHQGLALPEYLPTARGFDRWVGFYTGGQSHWTHITPYSVLGYEPEWWTPDDNASLPTHGCVSLWDIHNDSMTGALSDPTCSPPAPNSHCHAIAPPPATPPPAVPPPATLSPATPTPVTPPLATSFQLT